MTRRVLRATWERRLRLINDGGEGSPRYQVVEEKGTHEDDADIDQKRKSKFCVAAGRD